MLIGEIIRVAFQSIRANLFRSMLTTLGIIVGVGAVIAMLAAGAGAQKRIDDQLAALGSNILTLYTSQYFSMGVAREQMTLTVDDILPLEENSRYIDAVVPELQTRGQFELEGSNTNSRLIGTTYHYAELFSYPVANGRFFSHEEDQALRRVIVLGNDVPGDLDQAPEEIIGKTLMVNGQRFDVVGVLDRIGSSGGPSPDNSAFIPISTAEHRVAGNSRISTINLRVMDEVPLERAMVDIESVLRAEHKILPGQPNDFAIIDRKQFLATRQEAQQTFTFLLASIAGVSLLVGGIGIMNIMLVSVTERTHEIGIRKALGATRTNILMQFLVESIALCLFGGLAGIAAGATTANVLSRYAGWETFVSPESVALAFLFSIGVGLFFGIWPARRAARLDPIEALRYET